MSFFRGDAGGRVGALGQTLPGIVPGMPSFTLPPQVAQLLGPLPSAVYTPWAAQESDAAWVEIPTPSSDVIVTELGPALSLMSSIGVGLPGYVAFLTSAPARAGDVERAFEGTRYELESVLAVYRRDDGTQPPRIHFLYWGRLRDHPDAAPQPLDTNRLVGVGAKLVFAQQVGPQGQRDVGSFAAAAAQQFPGLVAPPAEPDLPPPAGPEPPRNGGVARAGASPGQMFVVGALAGVVGFFGVWIVRRQR